MIWPRTMSRMHLKVNPSSTFVRRYLESRTLTWPTRHPAYDTNPASQGAIPRSPQILHPQHEQSIPQPGS